MGGERLKAYDVVEVFRGLVQHTVYAHNYDDAKQRVREMDLANRAHEGVNLDGEPVGFESVRRCPEYDRTPTQNNPEDST